MTFRLMALLVLLVLLCAALSVAAQTVEQPGDRTEPCFWYDTGSCFEDDDDSGSGGDPSVTGYSYCVAKKSAGEECQSVVTVYIPNSACATGCRLCAGVTHSASCQCDSETLKVSGRCTYW